MQVNKQIIIILILASLLFSAIGAAVYFFNKNKQSIKNKNELVTIFIAKDDIKSGTLLSVSNLAQTKIAKQYVLNDPLLKKEILGKYTKETIYKNEIFLKQKLNTKIQKSRAKVLDFKSGSYNIKFEAFQNPNYSLVQGDLINIISVFPKEGSSIKSNDIKEYDVKYSAKNIKILGFLRDGNTESETITKQKIKKVVKKKIIEEIANIKANELIIDIEPNVLLELINDYNKGNQLWMVKTKESILIEPIDKVVTKEDIEEIKEKVKAKVKKVYKAKVYKYKWYTPTISTIQRSAVIDYSGDSKNEKSKTKNVNIIVGSSELCSSIKDKLIIGKVNSFYIRSEANTKSSWKSLLEKNTIIPYIQKIGLWYKTCDNKYISASVVNEISYKDALRKVGK